jgi:hypothetical protein
MLSTVTVTNNLDSGPGSLRADIAAAQSGDTVNFSPSLDGQTITLTSGNLAISNNLTIQGPGASLLTISGNHVSQVFQVSGAQPVVLSGLTISNGVSGLGGGINNGGTLTVSQCTLSGNSGEYGGGIANTGALTVSQCTLNGNGASSDGGGIYNDGTLTVSQSTLNGNSASLFGGGIYNYSYGGSNPGNATLTNVTLSGNSTQQGGAGGGSGGGLFVDSGTATLTDCTISRNYSYGYSVGNGSGSGIGESPYPANPRTVNLTNTIVAGNGQDGGMGSDIGYDVTTMNYCLFGFVRQSIVNPTGVGNIHIQYGSYFGLGPLQNNGGPTQTMALLAGSPAIGHADNSYAPATDQRGLARLDDAGETTDIGAFEFLGSLAVSGFPSPTTAGAAGSFTVMALNSDGTTKTGYTGTVHFTSTDAQAVLPADYTFTTSDAGVHTFSATLKTAGTQWITATDTVPSGVTSSEGRITVNPAAAASLALSNFPTSATAGQAGNFTVTARDPYGNIATGYLGTLHFTSSDGNATLPANYAFTASDAGAHTFSATLTKAGTQYIAALDTVFASLSASETGIMVNPGAATHFAITAPSTVKSGIAFSMTVTALDAYGNVATGYLGTIKIASAQGKGNLPSTYTFKATDKGVNTFTGVVFKPKGNHTITMTDSLDRTILGSLMVDVM